LIPDPNRNAAGYHGNNGVNLIQAIIDIHKIYQSLFDILFIIDGIFTACLVDFEKNTTKQYRNWGVIIGGNDGLHVDMIGKCLLRSSFRSTMKGLPHTYKENFGGNINIDKTKIPLEYYLGNKMISI